MLSSKVRRDWRLERTRSPFLDLPGCSRRPLVEPTEPEIQCFDKSWPAVRRAGKPNVSQVGNGRRS